jgi:hypothetical protein
VLVLSIYRGGGLLPAALDELRRTRHRLTLALGSMDDAIPALAADTVATGAASSRT